MKIVYAPDSYGGFLTSPDACRTVQKHLNEMGLAIHTHPMADGGEGTDAAWAFHSNAAGSARPFLEAAHFVGFDSAPEPLTPLALHTGALGSAMHEWIDQPFTVGLGGTATIDGGMGLLHALGMTVRDAAGQPMQPSAVALEQTRCIDWPHPPNADLDVLVDVRTPLAESIRQYGPQKGVLPHQIEPMTQALLHWASLLNQWRVSRQKDPIPLDIEGGGAAGGIAFALAACLDARLMRGAPHFAHVTGLERAIRTTDGTPAVVIVGEGRMDATSFEGKVLEVVCQQARKLGATVVALVGSQRQPIPPPPIGPDRIFVSGERPNREEAFVRTIRDLGHWLKTQ